ncbi:MAG: hypothetical protein AB7F32_07190 [Victivallaceae bacterium]
MKKLDLLLITLTLPAAVFAATAEGAGRELFDRQTAILSSSLLLTEWRNTFAATDFPAGTERIYREMKQNSAANAAAAAARKNTAAGFRDELRNRYSEEAAKILAPYRDVFVPSEFTKLTVSDNAFIEACANRLFAKSFDQARRKLAGEQRKTLFAKTYPAVEEFEKFNDDALAKLLENRFREQSGGALLEENLPLLKTEVIRPVIAAGRAQQQLQLTLVARQTVPTHIWDEKAARELIAAGVETDLAAAAPAKDRLPLFPKTRTQIQHKAARLAADRTIAALPDTSKTVQAYSGRVLADPVAHRDPEASLKMIAGEVQTELIAAAIAAAGVPEAQQGKVAEDAEVKRAAAKRFEHKIVPALREMRDKTAAGQLGKWWPDLAAGRWRPTPSEVEAFAAGGSREIPALTGRPASVPLLLEAEKQCDDALRVRLAAGVAELEKQRRLVNAEYDAVVGEMRQKQQQSRSSWLVKWFGASSVKLGEIVDCYRRKVTEKAGQDGELYPAIEAEIDVRSRAILQQLNEKPDQVKPELPVVKSSFELRQEGDQLILRSGDWTVAVKPGKEGELTAAAAAELKRLVEATPAPSRFEVELVVGDRIYYRTVADLREALRAAAGDNSRITDRRRK